MNKRTAFIAPGAVALALCASSASADFIGVELESFPDIFSSFLSVEFDAASDTFTADGFALTFDDDGSDPVENINNGGFSLTAMIDDSGVASGGSLSIAGEVVGVGNNLLEATLVDFGFSDNGGQVLEFIFSVTGGDLMAAYGGAGSLVGVVLGADGNYSGDWSQDFSGGGFGTADTAALVVPAPAAAMLLLAAGIGSSRRRRRA